MSDKIRRAIELIAGPAWDTSSDTLSAPGGEGKEKKVALIAAMRKFLTILNTLIKKDELWKTSP